MKKQLGVKERRFYKEIYHLDLDYPQKNTSELERFDNLKEIFDFVICADVLEHLKNPTEALALLASKLKFIIIPQVRIRRFKGINNEC